MAFLASNVVVQGSVLILLVLATVFRRLLGEKSTDLISWVMNVNHSRTLYGT